MIKILGLGAASAGGLLPASSDIITALSYARDVSIDHGVRYYAADSVCPQPSVASSVQKLWHICTAPVLAAACAQACATRRSRILGYRQAAGERFAEGATTARFDGHRRPIQRILR